MFKLMDKKIITILRWKILLNRPYVLWVFAEIFLFSTQNISFGKRLLKKFISMPYSLNPMGDKFITN